LLEKQVGNCYEGDWEGASKNALNSLRDEKGTDAFSEIEKGRLALWLEPKDIEFLLNQWKLVPDDESSEKLKTWGKLAFRCSAALHKSMKK